MKKSDNTKQRDHSDDVRAKITERAYFISQGEGFPHGKELMHWLEAESQILRELAQEVGQAVVKAVKRTSTKANATESKVSTGSAPKAAAPSTNGKSAAPKAAAQTAAKKAAPKKSAAKKPAAKKAAPKK